MRKCQSSTCNNSITGPIEITENIWYDTKQIETRFQMFRHLQDRRRASSRIGFYLYDVARQRGKKFSAFPRLAQRLAKGTSANGCLCERSEELEKPVGLLSQILSISPFLQFFNSFSCRKYPAYWSVNPSRFTDRSAGYLSASICPAMSEQVLSICSESPVRLNTTCKGSKFGMNVVNGHENLLVPAKQKKLSSFRQELRASLKIMCHGIGTGR